MLIFAWGGGLNYWIKYIEKFPLIKRNLISIIGIILSSLCLFFLGIVYSKALGSMWDIVWNGFGSLFTLFNVIFIVVLSLNYRRNFKIVSKISINSLGIYLIHPIFIRLLFPLVLNSDLPHNIFVNILFSLSILSFSLIISIILKKIPIIKNILPT